MVARKVWQIYFIRTALVSVCFPLDEGTRGVAGG